MAKIFYIQIDIDLFPLAKGDTIFVIDTADDKTFESGKKVLIEDKQGQRLWIDSTLVK